MLRSFFRKRPDTPDPTPAPPMTSSIPQDLLSAWEAGSEHELGFWHSWIASGGLKWKEGFARKSDPNAPLTPQIERLLPKIDLPASGPIKILDIGSGPLSWVGTKHPDFRIELTAVDPLADEYNRALDAKGITGVIRPQKGFFETALWQLGANRFDFVWCCNSLDHSIDPALGLFNIINVCKIGGGVLLSFHPDEAERENYAGLHQWNLRADKNSFVLAHRDKSCDLLALLKDQADVMINVSGPKPNEKPRTTVFFKKVADCNLSHAMMG